MAPRKPKTRVVASGTEETEAPRAEPEAKQPPKFGPRRTRILEMQQLSSGPDMPPGRPMAHLPKPDQVPPKPTEEPVMDTPPQRSRILGHAEWQLWSDFGDPIPGNRWPVIHREWRVRWVPPDEERCQARGIGKSNHWMGNRCVLTHIKGGKVCRIHGGNLANVKKAAQTALARATLPASEKLIHIALTKRGVSDADRIKAIIQILDRAGIEGKQTVEIELSLWQKTLQGVYNTAVAAEDDEQRELVEGEDYELEEDEEAEYEEDDDQ